MSSKQKEKESEQWARCARHSLVMNSIFESVGKAEAFRNVPRQSRNSRVSIMIHCAYRLLLSAFRFLPSARK